MSFKNAFFSFLKGEVSQVELEGYRRATSQIDDLEAAIETRAAEKPGPARPNEEDAAVLCWIARGLATVATTLIEVDEKEDPSTAGYLPTVTFGQAKALYVQVPDFVQRAWEALANPRYRPDRPLPMPLGPRVEPSGRCPLVHMKGIHAAARALDEYAEARLDAHIARLRAAGASASSEVFDELNQVRARARAKLAFTTEQLSALAEGSSVPIAAHEEAEQRLWEALSDCFLLGQFVAKPALLKSAAIAGTNLMGRTIPREERWFVAEPSARKELAGTKFGEREMQEFWSRKGWRTTPREERYFAQCAQLVAEGKLVVSSPWSTCPFGPVYRTVEPVTILDQPIGAQHEFNLDMDESRDELQIGTPMFRRTSSFEEEHEEGHIGDPTRR